MTLLRHYSVGHTNTTVYTNTTFCRPVTLAAQFHDFPYSPESPSLREGCHPVALRRKGYGVG